MSLRSRSFGAFSLLWVLSSCGAQDADPGAPAPTSTSPTTSVAPTTSSAPSGVTTPAPGSSTPTSTTAAPQPTGTVDSPVSPQPTQPGTTTLPTTTDPATTDPATTPTPTTTAGPTSSTTEAPTPPTPSGGDPAANQTSTELLATFDLGWNLGNSLDVPDGETAWGNPAIDAALLQTVKQAGFDIVRIPVTWSLFMGAAPNYTIEAARLDRVKEVVQYALDAGLYAIINVHHDGADGNEGVEWLTLNDASGAVTEANNMAVEQRFRAVWTQIADAFKAFDHHLLFESMNEIHDGYDAPKPEYYTIINHLNQVFIDVVRPSGGNNATRHLVVPGYNTNIDYTVAGFTAPNDTVQDRLILSIHYYDPYLFAITGEVQTWGAGAPGADDWGQEDYVVQQFDKLKTNFIDKGLPMIMGEYGAVNQAGYENYRRYYMEYVTQAACQRGMVPVYWDNGGIGTGADKFGLFDRTTKAKAYPDVLEAMFRGCNTTEPLTSIAKP